MSNSKSFAIRKSVISAFVPVAGLGLMFAAQPADAGIADTKHNLGSTNKTLDGGTNGNKFSGTAEICVFCHTPHGADTAAAVPLWNRVLHNTSIYSTFDQLGTSTLDGQILPVGSVSLACLSCHDGTQALNVMLNAPGSGGYNVSGGTLAGTWDSRGLASTKNGSMNYDSIVYIGSDLKNDHPIGIEFCGGGLTGTGSTVSGTCRDDSFNGSAVKTRQVGPIPTFWVDTNGDGTRQKTDFALYTRQATAGAFQGLNAPFVECASCHDPHVTNTTFLRRTNGNDGSGVCLTCHNK
jgi:predicted CXXCH cytochrome family protein